jgi:hypothetical protein
MPGDDAERPRAGLRSLGDATAGSIPGRLARVDGPPAPPEGVPGTGTNVVREAVQRWRLVLGRSALDGDVAQRTMLAEWEAALLASGLPVAGLDASRARPRFAIAAPLAAAIPGEAELIDVWLVERLPRWRVREAMLPILPVGHRLVDLYDVWLGEPPLPGRVSASVYRATIAGVGTRLDTLRAAAEAMIEAPSLPRERRKGDGVVAYDLRQFLVALEVAGAAGDHVVVRMTLRHDPEKGIGRPDETLAELGERLGGEPLRVVALVREGLVLAEPPATEPQPRPPRRRPAERPARSDQADAAEHRDRRPRR